MPMDNDKDCCAYEPNFDGFKRLGSDESAANNESFHHRLNPSISIIFVMSHSINCKFRDLLSSHSHYDVGCNKLGIIFNLIAIAVQLSAKFTSK